MSIKHHCVRLAEKIHGRKCTRCIFNHDGRCNLQQGAFARCWQSLARPYFAPRKQDKENVPAPGDLTDEEKYQMGKIVESLQEASTTAQDAGLLESPAPAIPRMDAYWDDRAESGLLEED